MTMIKALRIAVHFIFYSATKTAAFKHDWGHMNSCYSKIPGRHTSNLMKESESGAVLIFAAT
ncbi:MAG: hypothetical protein ACU83N_07610 [Gammaproteobacteria bacterium]